MTTRLLLLASLLTVWMNVPVAAAEEALPLRCTLSSPRAHYLLGELVVLRGSLKNVGKRPVEEYRLDGYHHGEALDVLLSEDGVRFEPYNVGIFPTPRVAWPRTTLKPGEACDFEVWILYDYKSPSRLAFGRPGTYYVKLGYPLITQSRKHRVVAESNVLAVEVKAPAGAEARVWEQIRRPEFLFFLHSGLVQGGHVEVPDKVLDLVRTKSAGAYDRTLRSALREYYEARRGPLNPDEQLRDGQLQKVREVLGIAVEKGPPGPFPDDRRLDVEITYHFPQFTPLEDVFAVISAAGGVPLRLAPELTVLPLMSLKVTRTLRGFMATQDRYKTMWIREDDGGYRLVPLGNALEPEYPDK